MKRFFYFLAAFAGVLLLAVLLAPPLFHVMPYKFERIFNRIVMIGVLVCAAVFVRVRRGTFTQYGFAWQRDSWPMLLTAFAGPVVILSVYVGLQTLFGEAVIAPRNISAAKWAGRIIGALFAGLLVGTIEEFFFRGFIFQFFLKLWAPPNRRTTVGLVTSLLVTNAFYSILHFMQAKKPFIDGTPDFHDSLRLLGAPFQALMHFDAYWPGFVGLLIFGLMLNSLYLRAGSLYPAIGLHAGAVFFLKTDGLLVDFGPANFLWGSAKMYDGAIGWLALAILYLVLVFFLSRITIHKSRIAS